MQIQFNDLTITPILESLEMLGFGVDIVYDANEVAIAATVWTEKNFEQSGQIGGYMCGQIIREFSSFAPRYTLVLDSGRLNAQRLGGVAQNVVSLSCR